MGAEVWEVVAQLAAMSAIVTVATAAKASGNDSSFFILGLDEPATFSKS